MIDFLLDIILTVAFLLGVVTAAAFIGLLVLIVIELMRRDWHGQEGRPAPGNESPAD